jgi:hypothetical protein
MGKRGPKKKERLLPWEEDRARRMLTAYVDDGLTLEQISKYHDVTRERVRQIVTAFDPGKYKVARMRRKARVLRERNIRIWKKQRALKRNCYVCGESFLRTTSQVYCSEIHYKLFVLLRYQIDDDFREMSQFSTARWFLKNGDVRQKRYAINVLTRGVEDSDFHRAGTRYMVSGSLVFHWAVRACVLGWPIFDQFHPDVQQQIKEYVG